MTVIDALERVVNEAKDPNAVVYARRGLSIPAGEGLRVQVLYVLSNLQGWRGERARETKEVLKQYIKGY